MAVIYTINEKCLNDMIFNQVPICRDCKNKLSADIGYHFEIDSTLNLNDFRYIL